MQISESARSAPTSVPGRDERSLFRENNDNANNFRVLAPVSEDSEKRKIAPRRPTP